MINNIPLVMSNFTQYGGMDKTIIISIIVVTVLIVIGIVIAVVVVETSSSTPTPVSTPISTSSSTPTSSSASSPTPTSSPTSAPAGTAGATCSLNTDCTCSNCVCCNGHCTSYNDSSYKWCTNAGVQWCRQIDSGGYTNSQKWAGVTSWGSKNQSGGLTCEKDVGDSCSTCAACKNWDCGTGKGTQCCNGTCQDKVKDWVGAYYCKSDCVGDCNDSS